jgi:hypothetical protein
MGRFNRHKWWISTLLLSVPVVALAQGLPNTFTPGTVISASQVNANFAALNSRLSAVESSLRNRTTVTVVMDNVIAGIGAGGLTRTFQTGGGDLAIIASGSAWWKDPTTLDVGVNLDGSALGHLLVHTNEGSSHKAFPTKVFHIGPLTPGTHTIGLSLGNDTTTVDFLDFLNLTVIETSH